MSKRVAKYLWYWLARWACRLFCILFFRLRVYGRENIPSEGSCILACNHQSYLDPILCGVAARRHLTYLARDTLFKNPYFAFLIRSVNTIAIRRGRADIAGVRRVISKLKEGKAVCIFPEATRSRDGSIADFKPGFGLLCRRSKAPLVPVLIDGAFEALPRNQKIISPGPITVRYGKCIPAEQIAEMSSREVADYITERLRQMQRRQHLSQAHSGESQNQHNRNSPQRPVNSASNPSSEAVRELFGTKT